MNDSIPWPHTQLNAWRIAVRARIGTRRLLLQVPRGEGWGEDVAQLRRSSQGIPKLIAEGANRWSKGTKRQRFDEAIGEIGETASGLTELVMMGVLDEAAVREVNTLWWRSRGAVIGLLKQL